MNVLPQNYPLFLQAEHIDPQSPQKRITTMHLVLAWRLVEELGPMFPERWLALVNVEDQTPNLVWIDPSNPDELRQPDWELSCVLLVQEKQ